MIFLSGLGIFALYIGCQIAGKRWPPGNAYWFFQTSHLIAGFLVAAALTAYLHTVAALITGSLVIGVLWEVWEFIYDRSAAVKRLAARVGAHHGAFTWGDTFFDLFLDLAGAFFFIYLFL